MGLKFERGFKSNNDWKCSFNCDNCGAFHNTKFGELAFIIVELCKNEDRLYPPEKSYRGGRMLLDFFNSAYWHNKNKEETELPSWLYDRYKFKSLESQEF